MLMITSKIKIYLGEKNPPQPCLELGCAKVGFFQRVGADIHRVGPNYNPKYESAE